MVPVSKLSLGHVGALLLLHRERKRPMPQYTFKIAPETVWIIAVAVLTPLLVGLSNFDPDLITDWRVWAVSIAASMIRAGAAAVIAALGPGGFVTK